MENYKLVELLKETDVCRVFLAFSKEEDVEVLVKVFKPDVIDSQFDERFLRWSKLLIEINHPNLLSYIDFVCEEGKYGFVTEETEFSSIYSLFEEKEVDVVKIYNTFRQILEATAYAHKQGVINGGFDLDKIYFEEDRVLLEDFGINNLIYPNLCLAGKGDVQKINIYDFYSPEQFDSSASVSYRSDIYSLGALLYTLTERRLPFEDVNDFETLSEEIRNREYIESSNDNVFASFIRKATRRDPADRYDSVEKWLEEWKNFSDQIIGTSATVVAERESIEQASSQKYEQTLVKVEEDMDKLKIRNRKRYTILILLVLLFAIVFMKIIYKEIFFNPKSYNFFTGKYLDRVFIVFRDNKLVDLISSSPQKYVFDLSVNLDSGQIVKSNVIDYRSNFLSNVVSAGTDIILAGGSRANELTSFPMLVYIRSVGYEPYYRIDENGFYVDIATKNCKIYLLKYLYGTTQEGSKVIVSRRDCMLNEEMSFSVKDDVLRDSVVPKAMKILKDIIIIEFYDYKTSRVQLIAFNQKGEKLWSKSLKSALISSYTTWYNMDVADNNLIWINVFTNELKSKLETYAFDTNGKMRRLIKFYPRIHVKSIDRLRVMNDKAILISVYTGRGYSLVYGFDQEGRTIIRRRFGFIDKIRITDFYLINKNRILFAGTSRSLLMTDSLKAKNIYLLEMIYPEGIVVDIPFPAEQLLSGNQ